MLNATEATAFAISIVTVAVPVPAMLLALTVTEYEPAAVGVPEISPVEELTLRPGGRPVALNAAGELLAVIV